MPNPGHIMTTAEIISELGDPADGASGARGAWVARNARQQHQEALQNILSTVEKRDGTVNDDEQRRFDAHKREADKLAVLADGYEERGNAEARVRAESGEVGAANEWRTQPGLAYTSSGGTYRKDDPHGKSWLRDMANFNLRGDPDAGERLRRNDRQVSVEHRALSTTDGAGGDFSPPSYLIDKFVDYARQARVVADLVQNESLPTGIDSLNVPRMVTGTATAEQATQNTAVQNTDATTDTITAAVATIAGQQTVSLQLIEQSPINVDTMILQDLIADLAAKTDLFVLNNNAANKKGLLQAASTNAITFTSASPTVALFYSKVADAIQQVQLGTFRQPDAIVMHPRRWAWLLAAVDGQSRPLIVPNAQGPFSAIGTTQTAAADGSVGSLQGLPVYLDSQVPVNTGAGTNQDPVIVMAAKESTLWQGALNAQMFREPLAGQLSVVLRTYRYVAFSAARRPKSISIVNGTGMTPPVL